MKVKANFNQNAIYYISTKMTLEWLKIPSIDKYVNDFLYTSGCITSVENCLAWYFLKLNIRILYKPGCQFLEIQPRTHTFIYHN